MTHLEHGIYIDTAVGTQDHQQPDLRHRRLRHPGLSRLPELGDRGERDRRHRHGRRHDRSEGGTPSSGNTVRRNIIVNSKGAPVATYWGGSAGSGNSAVDNCVSNTLAQGSYAGLTASGTKVVASSGLDASYKLAAGAACAGYGPASSQARRLRRRQPAAAPAPPPPRRPRLRSPRLPPGAGPRSL